MADKLHTHFSLFYWRSDGTCITDYQHNGVACCAATSDHVSCAARYATIHEERMDGPQEQTLPLTTADSTPHEVHRARPQLSTPPRYS